MSLNEQQLEVIANKEKQSNRLIKAAVTKVQTKKLEARRSIEDYLDARNVKSMFDNLEC